MDSFSVELIYGMKQKKSTPIKRQNLNQIRRKKCCSIRKKRQQVVFLEMMFCLIGLMSLAFIIGRISIRKELFLEKDNTSKNVTTMPALILDKNYWQAENDVEWNLLLVNYKNPLPKDFVIPELTQLRDGHAIDSRAYPSLQLMMDDAREAGLDPMICSSFRTWEKQEELYDKKVQSLLEQGFSQKEAEAQAKEWVAYPGTSEHQIGLAVDIVDTAYQQLDKKQEDTKVQKWLIEHCAEYGFILRYPTGKSEITGIGYEPWHYRYVGKEVAQVIMEQGICLEEYLLQ